MEGPFTREPAHFDSLTFQNARLAEGTDLTTHAKFSELVHIDELPESLGGKVVLGKSDAYLRPSRPLATVSNESRMSVSSKVSEAMMTVIMDNSTQESLEDNEATVAVTTVSDLHFGDRMGESEGEKKEVEADDKEKDGQASAAAAVSEDDRVVSGQGGKV